MQEERSVRELAHRLWVARGCPEGSAEQDWLDAERQLVAASPASPKSVTKSVDDTLKDTFPASDPPASHLPDKPPANAAEKWAAADAARKETAQRAAESPGQNRRPPAR